MNETNALIALGTSLVLTNVVSLTNWQATGDMQRKGSTNYVEKFISEISTVDWREVITPKVVYVTNKVAIKTTRELFSGTNAVKVMVPVMPPPLPGVREKE